MTTVINVQRGANVSIDQEWWSQQAPDKVLEAALPVLVKQDWCAPVTQM